MTEYLNALTLQLGLPAETLLVIGIGCGVVLICLGIGALLTESNPAADRIAALQDRRRTIRGEKGLLQAPTYDPQGIWKAVIPSNLSERADLTRKLARAGLHGAHSLRNFTLVRIVLGAVVPAIFVGLVILARTPGVALPLGLSERLGDMSDRGFLNVTVLLVAIGYFGPVKWLNDRAGARQRKVEEALPNALDLMQISVESGLGFDAAMTRVGNELIDVSPEIAFEFLTVQRQVQAGRPRDTALSDMALRTGVDTVRSFANVVTQSIRFGSSMSAALTAYSAELRDIREMRAQEAANKLPVKMSGVLAALMLPALILLTVGPVIIRYLRLFA